MTITTTTTKNNKNSAMQKISNNLKLYKPYVVWFALFFFC